MSFGFDRSRSIREVELSKEKEPVAYADIPFTTKDVSSMEFAIAGEVMTFPCTMTDLYDAGYSMNESDAKIMLGQPASLMIEGISHMRQQSARWRRVILRVSLMYR